jgi:hypothetical protein
LTAAEAAAKAAYAETAALLSDPSMARVVTHGLTLLYGPPIQNPDLFVISFQGGGAAPVVYDKWPARLLYLDDEFKPGNAFKFGRHLCRYAREVGMYDVLVNSTVAVPAVFPGGPESSAGAWLGQGGPHKRWRDFSVAWVQRFVDACRPKVVIVFGGKTSRALGLDDAWRDVAHNHGQGWMTFGRTEWRGFQTLFTTHLSRPVRDEVIRALTVAREIIGHPCSSAT